MNLAASSSNSAFEWLEALVGLRYWFEAPKTALGDELLEALERRDITSSSFAFQIKNDKWEKRSGCKYLRTITAFDQLFDVSPVYQPAYEGTTVDKRGLEAILKLEDEELSLYNKIKEYKTFFGLDVNKNVMVTIEYLRPCPIKLEKYVITYIV